MSRQSLFALTAVFGALAVLNPNYLEAHPAGPASMVIVTDAAQATAYQRLADFKTAIGVRTEVHRVSDIVAAYPDVDTPASIRSFLQHEFEFGPLEYVLLGGAETIIPFRLARTTFFGGRDLPTDLYYSDLDGIWNADGDSFFGEGYVDAANPGDNLDLFPDVFVGRLPTKNAVEADLVVDKILSYQTSPPASFVNTAIFGGNVLFPQNWLPGQTILYDAAAMAQNIVDNYLPLTVSVDRIYQNSVGYPGSTTSSVAALTAALEVGTHFNYYQSNGSLDVFKAGNETMDATDIESLTNGDRAGIFIARTGACAQPGPQNVAYSWVLNPNGGGVATFGSTGDQFPTTVNAFDEELFDLHLNHGEVRLGRLSALAKNPFVPLANTDSVERWTIMVLHLIGDPEMPVWTQDPESFYLVHDGVLLGGATSYTVSVLDGSSPLEGVRVALHQEGEAYAVGSTDAFGTVSLSFNPELGPFTVGAWKQDYLPVIEDAVAATTAGLPIPELGIVSLAAPNPFYGQTTISFRTAEASAIRVEIFDLQGRRVRGLLDCHGCQAESVVWDGRNDQGMPVPAGFYAYRITTPKSQESGKVVLLP